MCGRCRHVFNAFEALKRVQDSDAGEPIDYTLVDSTREIDTAQSIPLLNAEQAPQSASRQDDGEQVVTKDAFDSYEDALKKLEQFEQSQLSLESSVHPIDRTLAARVVPLDDVSTAAEPTSTGPESAPHIPRAAKPPAEPELASTTETDSRVQFSPKGAWTTNPLIGGSTPERAAESRAWGWLAAAAGVLLGLQLAYYFRSEIVQQYPQLRPQMAAACEAIGCAISWGRDTALIKIESSDLIEPPGRPGRILLTAILANRAATKQDFPVLEVKLTDANNAVLSSRVLMPADYLGRVPATGEGLAPNIELYVNLDLELTGKVPASGYGLRAFYP